jgi:hypothetical protein
LHEKTKSAPVQLLSVKAKKLSIPAKMVYVSLSALAVPENRRFQTSKNIIRSLAKTLPLPV